MGHAGTDFEVEWRALPELCAAEAQDPLLRSAQIALESGWMDAARSRRPTRRCVRAAWPCHHRRRGEAGVAAGGDGAAHRTPAAVQAEAQREVAAKRARHYGGIEALPERRRRGIWRSDQPRPAGIAGEVSAEPAVRRGRGPEPVYTVTKDLLRRFGPRRVFNTLLDETMILGMAQGRPTWACCRFRKSSTWPTCTMPSTSCVASLFAAVLLQRPVPQPDAAAGGRAGATRRASAPLPQRQLDHRPARHPRLVVGCRRAATMR